MNKKYNVPLPEDHPLREFAFATARENATKLRDIYTTDLPGANALITISGNLALSDDLIANLDQDELRAIVAHEIGHQRRKDSIRLLSYSLAIVAVVLLCYQWLATRLEGSRAALRFLFVFAAMTPIIPYILLGKRRRQAELEADRFAVKVTKDPELVIRALTKVTHLNEAPIKLAKIDEALSTHPSLESRINAIRALSRNV
jgi:STE24 endopeptidase